MKFLALSALLVLPALAQNATVNTTALAELANAFQQAGLTSLAAIAQQAAGTPEGQRLLAALTDGKGNKTIFAPSNAALAKSDSKTPISPAVLAYHLAQGPYLNTTDFFNAPNDTIILTYLNDTSAVHLGNQSQVLVANVKDGKVVFKNQPTDITVTAFANFSNFDILTIDGVLTPPGDIESVLQGAGLTAFVNALQQGGLFDKVKNASGITLFAPSNDAITKALAGLGAQATNTTLVDIILGNHIINGSAVYSSQFGKSYTSASGESFKFNVTQNSTSISSGDSGNFTANITRLDLLASNGVVHVLDGILANTANDSKAADNAYSSASSAAANPTSTNGPVGSAPPGSNAGGATSIQIPFTAITMVVGGLVFGTLLL